MFKQQKQLKNEFEEQRDKHDELIFSLQLQILVEITEVLETELNLIQAFKMIITELNYLNQMKKQVKAQICYVSQKNSRTMTYLLCNTTLKIKKSIYDH